MANEDEARKFAADYLASLPGSPTSIAPSAPSPIDLGDIDAPAPVGDRIKRGIGTAFTPPPGSGAVAKSAAKGLGAVALGPVPAVAQGLVTTTEAAPPSKVLEQALPGGFKKEETKEPAGPESPPGPPTTDPPIMLGPGMGGGQRMVSPAGMYPHSMTTQAHVGRPVPQSAIDAYGYATALRLQGAEEMRDANQGLHAQEANLLNQRLQANREAEERRLRVEADKKAMVDQSMAQMRAINEEASAAIDPGKYWTDRGAGAGVVGAIAIALGEFSSKLRGGPNTAMQLIENGINREVQAQVQNRQLAQHKLGQAQNLYNLHLQHFGDQERAIEATKLGLYDNILAQAEQFRMQHGIMADDAAYKDLVGGILEKQGDTDNRVMLQSTDDINRQYTEQWHNAQYAGTGAGGAKYEDPKHIITIPASDKTGEKEVSVAVPESVYKDLSSQQGMTNQLVTLNQSAKKTRAELREAVKAKDIKAINTLQKRLEGYNNTRVALAEKAKDPNSAVRDPEFNRQLATGVDYTAGVLGHDVGTNVDKAIDNDSNTAQSLTDARLRGATGQVVRHGINRDQQGRVVNQWLPTGEIYRGRAVAPEKKK